MSIPAVENLRNWLAARIEIALEHIYEKPMGFSLLVFRFDEIEGSIDYVSNAKREDMIKVLREAADKLEANEDIPCTKGVG